jgi:hypothetical protein
MNIPARHSAALTLLILALIFAGCTTTGGATDEIEPPLIDAERAPPADAAASTEETAPIAERGSKQDEGEVPLAVAESEQPEKAPKEVVVQGSRNRHEAIHDLVAEAQTLLRDIELQYVFTGKGKKQVLRGRPVAFALWSEGKQEWSVARIELPRPPIKWKPGGRPLAFRTLTPGIQARHVNEQDAVEGAELRRLLSRSIQDQQLLLQEKRFGDDGAGTARTHDPDRRDDQVSHQNEPIAHTANDDRG